KRGQVLHYSLEEECQGIPGQDQKAHQEKPRPDGRRTDRRTESTDSWMGLVSPACGEQERVSCGRSRSLQSPLGLCSTKAPPQHALVDQGEILAVHWPQSLGVHRSPQG